MTTPTQPPGIAEFEVLVAETIEAVRLEREFSTALRRATLADKRNAILLHVAGLERERDAMQDALDQVRQWSEAYPLAVFPEPDFAKAHELLKAGGMALDAISGSNMRHVIAGVQKIVEAAIAQRGGKDV